MNQTKSGIQLESLTTAQRTAWNAFNGTVVYDSNLQAFFKRNAGNWVMESPPPITVINNTLVITTSAFPTYEDVINTNAVLPTAGTYEIEINYSWNADTAASDFVSNLVIDGSDLSSNPPMHRQEAKDAANNSVGQTDQVAGTGTAQRYSFSRTYEQVFATAGAKSVLFQIASEVAGAESSVWDTRIRFQRIA